MQLHARFPSLRIVLEHVSTAAAIRAVKSKPSNVAATITPHHLMVRFPRYGAYSRPLVTAPQRDWSCDWRNRGGRCACVQLTVGDVIKPEAIKQVAATGHATCSADAVAQPHNFCKPIAKTEEDREALRQVSGVVAASALSDVFAEGS